MKDYDSITIGMRVDKSKANKSTSTTFLPTKPYYEIQSNSTLEGHSKGLMDRVRSVISKKNTA